MGQWLNRLREKKTSDTPLEEAPSAFAPEPPSKWCILTDSGLHHNEVADHAEVLFLFACELIRDTAPALLARTWAHYSTYWCERLPRETFLVVERRYQKRLAQTQPGPTQWNIKQR